MLCQRRTLAGTKAAATGGSSHASVSARTSCATPWRIGAPERGHQTARAVGGHLPPRRKPGGAMMMEVEVGFGGHAPVDAQDPVCAIPAAGHANITTAVIRSNSPLVAPACSKSRIDCITPRKYQASAATSAPVGSSPTPIPSRSESSSRARCCRIPESAAFCPAAGRSTNSAQLLASRQPAGRREDPTGSSPRSSASSRARTVALGRLHPA